MLLQKMALDLIDGTENTGILFLEEDELLAVLQERMHRDKAGRYPFPTNMENWGSHRS